MSCRIFIKDVDGKIIELSVNSEDELKTMTVEQLKTRLFPEEEHDQWRIIFSGKQLEDGRTLGCYNINDCSTLHLVIRLRGGAKEPDDEDKGMHRTASMEALAGMQQIEPKFSSCCMM